MLRIARSLVAAFVLAGPVVAAPTFALAQSSTTQLAQARIEAAAAAYIAADVGFRSGVSTAETVYTWSVRWLLAQRDTGLKGQALVAATEAHKKRMELLEATVEAHYKSGMARASDKAAAAYYRIEADLWLAEAKAR